MNIMPIIDENGLFQVTPGTLNIIQADNPAYRARIAVALPIGAWLYAPTTGHDLNQYKNLKATPSNVDSFEKSLVLYLNPYGPSVTERFASRGVSQLQIRVTKETLDV